MGGNFEWTWRPIFHHMAMLIDTCLQLCLFNTLQIRPSPHLHTKHEALKMVCSSQISFKGSTTSLNSSIVCTNSEGEITSSQFSDYVSYNDILIQLTHPNTSYSNNKAEMFHRTVMNSACAILRTSTQP